MRLPFMACAAVAASAAVSNAAPDLRSSASTSVNVYSSSDSVSDFSRQLAAQATCTYESDLDYVANDVANVPGAATDCCDKCSARSDCNAFTWTNFNGGTCWLKSGKGATKATTGAKSGVVATVATPPPSTTTPTATAPAGCTLEAGVDYTGNDIANVPGASASDCCAKCSARSGCGAFSWSNFNGGTCWLKSGKGSVVSNAAVTSGVVASTPAPTTTTTAPPPSTPATTCSTVEQGIDYVGNDIGNVRGTGAADCCTKCTSRAGCGAFSWSNYNGGTCWLKSGKGATTSTTGVVSGVVATVAATPSPSVATVTPQTSAPATTTPTTAPPATSPVAASAPQPVVTSTHVQYKIRSGAIPSRSVNLGGWLVCEYWMSKTSPVWKNVPDGIAGSGEYGVMQYLGKDQGTKQFEAHRTTWITEADIKEIASVGLNMVRVPVGFWIVEDIAGVASTNISAVYARGSLKYLDTLINDWAVKYNVGVYLSLHAHQGSQNGYDHSAPQTMGKTSWSDLQANVDNSVRFATLLASRYKDAQAFVGLQLMNEPAGNTNAAVRDAYYIRAYNEIRATGNNCIIGISPMLYQQDRSVMRDFMLAPKYTNVWVEWHTYYKWGYENLPEDTIISLVKTYRDSHFVDWPGNYVLVGEWSLGNGWNEEKFKDLNKLKEFASAQIQQFSEAHAGWAFWSWHHDDEYLKEADGRAVVSGWNLRQLIRLGVITIPK